MKLVLRGAGFALDQKSWRSGINKNARIEQTLRIAHRAIVIREGRVSVDEPVGRLYAKEVLSEVGL